MKRRTEPSRNPGPPFVAGEAICPRCAKAHRTDAKYPGHPPPPLVACVVCGIQTRTRVKG